MIGPPNVGADLFSPLTDEESELLNAHLYSGVHKQRVVLGRHEMLQPGSLTQEVRGLTNDLHDLFWLREADRLEPGTVSE